MEISLQMAQHKSTYERHFRKVFNIDVVLDQDPQLVNPSLLLMIYFARRIRNREAKG